MFIGKDQGKKILEFQRFFENREVNKGSTTVFSGKTYTHNRNTLSDLKKSMPFKNMIDFNTQRNQIQSKYVGDNVVFTDYLTEFYHLLSEKINFSKNGKR